MNVRNCRKCGRIFNYVMGPFICPACREQNEAKFQEVKEYVREHRNTVIQEVADACDIEVSQIHQWLREERLELVEGSGIVLICEGCGTAIMSGRYCEKCKRDLTSGFKEAIAVKPKEPEKKKDQKERDRMRFL